MKTCVDIFLNIRQEKKNMLKSRPGVENIDHAVKGYVTASYWFAAHLCVFGFIEISKTNICSQ